MFRFYGAKVTLRSCDSDWLKDADGRLRLNLAIEAAKSWSALLSASLH
jgi:hypothetical protein